MTMTPFPPTPPAERKVAFLTILDDDRPLHTLSFTLPAELVARIARLHNLTEGTIELLVRSEDEHALSMEVERQIDAMLPETDKEALSLLHERDAASRLAGVLGLEPPERPEEVEALLHSEAAEAAFERLSAELAEELAQDGYDPQTARPITCRLLSFRPR